MISKIRDIAAQLQAAYPMDEAEALAWWIAEELSGLSRTQLLSGCKITENFANTQEFVERLLHFEPIQYIFGHTEWYGLDLKVSPATLIPRPETAELVELVSNRKHQIANNQSSFRVLDIGTGSGCIAIALKKKHPQWQITGIDISTDAIEVAKENAYRNNADVDFRVADIFDFNGENGQFDIVVSNPPYICEKERTAMRRNVLDYEPAQALFVPDSDPLLFYRRIAALHLGNYLFFEINEAYSAELTAMMAEQGYKDIHVTNDMYGKPRIIEGRMA